MFKKAESLEPMGRRPSASPKPGFEQRLAVELDRLQHRGQVHRPGPAAPADIPASGRPAPLPADPPEDHFRARLERQLREMGRFPDATEPVVAASPGGNGPGTLRPGRSKPDAKGFATERTSTPGAIPTADQELASVVDRWPELSPAARAIVMSVVRAHLKR